MRLLEQPGLDYEPLRLDPDGIPRVPGLLWQALRRRTRRA